MSSLDAGAEMMTFLTVVPRWALALAPSVKKPVDSTTISAPTEAQSSLAGSRSEKTLICLPSTEMNPSPDVTSFFRLPRIEFEQVGQRGRAGQVVDGNKLNLRIAKSGAKNVAANTAEAIDSNLNCHVHSLLRRR
jgi:hypothetical protein